MGEQGEEKAREIASAGEHSQQGGMGMHLPFTMPHYGRVAIAHRRNVKSPRESGLGGNG